MTHITLLALMVHHHETFRMYSRTLFRSHHWPRWQFKYLNLLWDRESGWRKLAQNPYSGAYGIPQALPGWKMGHGWRTSGRLQVRWGERYIHQRYGTPYWAWQHEIKDGWY